MALLGNGKRPAVRRSCTAPATAGRPLRPPLDSLLPRGLNGDEGRKPFLTKTLRVVVALDDAKLAEALIALFQLHQLSAQAMPHLVALLNSHGLTWCRERFSQWAGGGRRYYNDGDKEWLKFMPTFCRELCGNGADIGRELAQWVVAHQWSVIEKQCTTQLEDRESPHAQSELSDLSKKLIWVIDSCVAAGADETHRRILKFLTGPANGYPVKCLVAALQECRKNRSPKEVSVFCAISSETGGRSPTRGSRSARRSASRRER